MKAYALLLTFTAASLAWASGPNIGPGPAGDELQDRVPEGWNLTELGRASRTSTAAHPDVRILVWEIIEDNRPLYVESCVVWMHWVEPGGKPKWSLAHLYRHPRLGEPPHLWQLSEVDDAKQVPAETFDDPPANREVYRFLRKTWWKFDPPDRFHILDASVCVKTWQKAIGEGPIKFYDGNLFRPVKAR